MQIPIKSNKTKCWTSALCVCVCVCVIHKWIKMCVCVSERHSQMGPKVGVCVCV